MENAPSPQRENIELAEDRELLAAKLKEYESRIRPYDPPEMQLDTFYKIEILRPLMERGTINRTEIHNLMRSRFGTLDEREFHNAWGVIERYVYAGGKGLFGGTGLPKRAEPDEIV